MIMVADLWPGLKRFLRPVGLRQASQAIVLRVIVTFLCHPGRMSCLQAAARVRCDARHRAQAGRRPV
ncbi:MAG: hypothetical protein ACREJB_18990 [Planctomycetaceae bacterium]